VLLLLLAQAEDFGQWGKLGVFGVIAGLLVWVLTQAGPRYLNDFRGDVSKLADVFTKSLTEKDAQDAINRAADREALTKIADQFVESLKDERNNCREERAADRDHFRTMVKEIVRDELREQRRNA